MARRPFNWKLFGNIAAPLCIAALLVAILFPVFQKVSEGNHSPRCPFNMKQLGLALVQYTQDADEKYPPGVDAAGNGWAGQIYSYCKTTGIYHCPDDAEDRKYISYAENQNLAGQSVALLDKPAATIELYEFSTQSCDPSTPETVSTTGLSAPQDSTRHNPATFGLNFLATDGQVKLLTPGQVSGGHSAVSASALPHGAVVETFAAK